MRLKNKILTLFFFWVGANTLLLNASHASPTVKVFSEIIDYTKIFDPENLFDYPLENRNYVVTDMGYASNKILLGFDADFFDLGTNDWVKVEIEMDRPEYPHGQG